MFNERDDIINDQNELGEGALSEDAFLHKYSEMETFEDPAQHLWAVSYADTLMIMLLFFVYLFVTGSNDLPQIEVPKDRPVVSALEGVAKDLSKMILGREFNLGREGTSNPKNDESLKAAEAAEMVRSANAYQVEKIKRAKERRLAIEMLNMAGFTADSDSTTEEVVVHLPNDVFEPGVFELPQSAKNEIERLVEILRPRMDGVDLVVIGHSDQVPMRQRKDHLRVVENNMILSALRAAKAADFIVKLGLPEDRVLIRGVGRFDRNTRSLSIRISERYIK